MHTPKRHQNLTTVTSTTSSQPRLLTVRWIWFCTRRSQKMCRCWRWSSQWSSRFCLSLFLKACRTPVHVISISPPVVRLSFRIELTSSQLGKNLLSQNKCKNAWAEISGNSTYDASWESNDVQHKSSKRKTHDTWHQWGKKRMVHLLNFG